MKASKLKKEFVSFTFLLPALLFFVLFVVVPFIQGFPISMMEWDGMRVEKQEGLAPLKPQA